ncbi:AAA family ATPase [Marinobacter sp. SS5-14b]|uniref:AAA family ATPase n=1 Tax=Marinobacter sp. SS5-14b TaxID=3050456 RepID=UPI0026E0A0CE|nr:AAA family ATPase [Marinobacter sp. SS5-14b]
MSQRFRTGLVVGKFSPLHSGHRYLLSCARAGCERLIVISYSRPEFAGCTKDLRRGWLGLAVPDGECLVIDAVDALKLGLDMPNNAASDTSQRQFCADLVDRCFGEPVDVIFSSEDYGQGFADYLSAHWQTRVASILVDRDRVRFPVSGSALRAQPDAAWVGDSVHAAQTCQRIALIGAESTGKTKLGAWLARQRGWHWVAEFGRQYWHEQGGVLTSDDLVTIALTQVENENEAVEAAVAAGHTAIVCDTTPLTTLIYHHLMFDYPPPPELVALAERPYHQLWLCAADFPMVQDGTRRPEGFRQQQQALHHAELTRRGLHFEALTGSLAQRKHHLLSRQAANAGDLIPSK